MVLGIYEKSVSKTPDFKHILDYYLETLPSLWEHTILTKTMEYLVSTPTDTIYTFDETQAVAY